MNHCLEDHPRTCKWGYYIIWSPAIYKPLKPFGRGPTTQSLGDNNDYHGYSPLYVHPGMILPVVSPQHSRFSQPWMSRNPDGLRDAFFVTMLVFLQLTSEHCLLLVVLSLVFIKILGELWKNVHFFDTPVLFTTCMSQEVGKWFVNGLFRLLLNGTFTRMNQHLFGQCLAPKNRTSGMTRAPLI